MYRKEEGFHGQTHLSRSRLDMLLFNLNLHYSTRMLNDFGDEGDMPSTNLPHDPLDQIYDRTVDPELPEDPDTITKWGRIRLDHAECAMDGPEDEEHNEQMVNAPESLEVCPSRLLQ